MINLGYKCEGKFQLIVSKDAHCDDVVHDTGVFDNLVLDSGLNMLCNQGLTVSTSSTGTASIAYLAVGSGTAQPQPSDSSLQNTVASLSLKSSSTLHSFTTSYARGYIEMYVSRQFPEGAAAGNISEIGIGASAYNLFSRTLIADGQGNPTTITILPDEFLTVRYYFRLYIPKSDSVFNINVIKDGVSIPTTVTVRPVRCNRAISKIQGGEANTQLIGSNGFSDLTELLPPESNQNADRGTRSITVASYQPNSHKRDFVFSFGTSDANSQNNSLFLCDVGPQPWQMLFNPPISKTSLEVLTLTTGFSVSRTQ